MSSKIVAGFLAGAVAATTGAYLAVRRVAMAPPPGLTIVVKPPAAPELAIPSPIPAAAGIPTHVAIGRTPKPEPPPFYLDPRPPAAVDPAPEPDPPVLSTAVVKVPATTPSVDIKLPPPMPHVVTIPEGTPLAVRLSEAISTKTHRTGQVFTGTLEQELVIEGFVIAARGSRVEGRISESDPAGRLTGLARLSLELTNLNTTDGQRVEIRTTHFIRSGPASKTEDGAKIALGAGLGAAIGAASAQGKGAAIGAAAGAAAGAASVAMTRGKPAELPVESRVTFKLQDPVRLTEKLDQNY